MGFTFGVTNNPTTPTANATVGNNGWNNGGTQGKFNFGAPATNNATFGNNTFGTNNFGGNAFGNNVFGANKGFGAVQQTNASVYGQVPKLSLGLSCFNENQSQREVSELQYYQRQIMGNEQFQHVFYKPKLQTTTTTYGGFGGTTTASAAQQPDNARNYDINNLQAVRAVNGFADLNQKLQQTEKDIKQVQQIVDDATKELDYVMQDQQQIMQSLNNLIEAQNIVKIEFFKRYQLSDYQADTQISRLK